METPYPFPTEMPFRGEDVERDFWRLSCTRSPDRAFHVRMSLPKDWRRVDVPADPPTPERPIGLIACFRTLDEPRAETQVSASLLSREIAPGAWLDNRLSQSGHEMLHRRDTETQGGVVSDVLSRSLTPEGPVISRWLAVKDGKHLFLVQARTLEAHYEAFANTFFMAIAGFDLMHPSGWPLAESLRTFTRRDPGDFLILFPQSWEIVEDAANNPNALVVQLRNVIEATAVGQITFAVIKRSAESDPQRLAAHYVEELRSGGVPLKALRLSPARRIDGFEMTWRASGQAIGPGGAAEILVVVGQRPDAWFLVGLLGPARTTAADIWAINRRAFDIVLTYLRTPGLPADV